MVLQTSWNSKTIGDHIWCALLPYKYRLSEYICLQRHNCHLSMQCMIWYITRSSRQRASLLHTAAERVYIERDIHTCRACTLFGRSVLPRCKRSTCCCTWDRSPASFNLLSRWHFSPCNACQIAQTSGSSWTSSMAVRLYQQSFSCCCSCEPKTVCRPSKCCPA